jgi:uncharacterized protein (TIGR03083 family)
MEHEAWNATRAALADTSRRCADLLRSVDGPEARAVGDWSVGDVAAHLIEVSFLNTLLATNAPPPSEWAEVYAKAVTASMDQVSDMNALALTVVRERAPQVLAARLEEQVGQLLDGTATADGSEQVEWLGGTKVPLLAVLGHTLSEVFVHGNDVARTMRRSFPLEPSSASLIFRVFLSELLRSPDVATFAGSRGGQVRPVSVELRLRGGPWMTLVSTSEGVRVEDPTHVSPDVRITADPAALWLVMSGRRNPVRAAIDRSVFVWGRRPWRLPRLTDALRPA